MFKYINQKLAGHQGVQRNPSSFIFSKYHVLFYHDQCARLNLRHFIGKMCPLQSEGSCIGMWMRNI